jgi:hypothetical protein
LYEYKDVVGIPPLAMVDGLALISKCGLDSVLINGYINQKTNIKKLQFGVDKCHKMHIGQQQKTFALSCSLTTGRSNQLTAFQLV